MTVWMSQPQPKTIPPTASLGKTAMLPDDGAEGLRDLATQYVVTPAALVAVEPERAREINDNLPFKLLGAAARPLVIGQSEVKLIATDCLARAVYYEARSEPLSGQRAVAQVVLNRARHPAFPSTICGVVYQGSERTTGCQFTFTCDGSQAIKPAGPRWSLAIKIAQQALGGFVERDVGWATHYHADYVVPYWASDLDKIAAIGRHVFYRWSRGWGTAPAFKQRYAATEFDPLARPTLTIENVVDDSSAVLSGVSTSPSRNLTSLRADDGITIAHTTRSKLAADEAAPLLREDLQGKPRLKVDEGRN